MQKTRAASRQKVLYRHCQPIRSCCVVSRCCDRLFRRRAHACRKFLGGVPAHSGMAFILVQHLDPTHPSMLVGLLAGQTPLKVCEATERARSSLSTSMSFHLAFLSVLGRLKLS